MDKLLTRGTKIAKLFLLILGAIFFLRIGSWLAPNSLLAGYFGGEKTEAVTLYTTELPSSFWDSSDVCATEVCDIGGVCKWRATCTATSGCTCNAFIGMDEMVTWHDLGVPVDVNVESIELQSTEGLTSVDYETSGSGNKTHQVGIVGAYNNFGGLKYELIQRLTTSTSVSSTYYLSSKKTINENSDEAIRLRVNIIARILSGAGTANTYVDNFRLAIKYKPRDNDLAYYESFKKVEDSIKGFPKVYSLAVLGISGVGLGVAFASIVSLRKKKYD